MHRRIWATSGSATAASAHAVQLCSHSRQLSIAAASSSTSNSGVPGEASIISLTWLMTVPAKRYLDRSVVASDNAHIQPQHHGPETCDHREARPDLGPVEVLEDQRAQRLHQDRKSV